MRSTGSELLERIRDEMAKAKARKAALDQELAVVGPNGSAPEHERGARRAGNKR